MNESDTRVVEWKMKKFCLFFWFCWIRCRINSQLFVWVNSETQWVRKISNWWNKNNSGCCEWFGCNSYLWKSNRILFIPFVVDAFVSISSCSNDERLRFKAEIIYQSQIIIFTSGLGDWFECSSCQWIVAEFCLFFLW